MAVMIRPFSEPLTMQVRMAMMLLLQCVKSIQFALWKGLSIGVIKLQGEQLLILFGTILIFFFFFLIHRDRSFWRSIFTGPHFFPF